MAMKIMVKLSLVDIILMCKLRKAEVENLRQSLQWIHACGNCNMQIFKTIICKYFKIEHHHLFYFI